MSSQPSALSSQLKAKRGPVRRRLGEGGFALLLTITLLAFLVVLLIGLAAYSRVETAIAGNTQRQAQARQNALLALNVALGQLQKYAGPDQRVTATADAFSATNKHFTGVWDTTQPASTTPLTWLVSGNDGFAADGTPNPLAKKPTTPLSTAGANPTAAELVGRNSSLAANDVLAPLVNITAVGVPGNTTATGPVIGKYAWWIGDQGVKAPVATADTTASVDYKPWDSAELRARLRQQIALGAGAADANGNPVFEPRDTNNSAKDASGKMLVEKATAYNQLAFLRDATTSASAVGLAKLKTYFHAWSPNNFAVLANTKLGGLRQDLSLAPTLLGSAFAAWANYDPANGGYMEDFTNPATPAPLPAYGSDPLRRRYKLTPPPTGGESSTVAPVLAMCGLSFNIRTLDGHSNEPLEVRARWYVSLWNPYASAIAPEDLRLEIEGLPDPITYTVTDSVGTVVRTETVSLNSLFADPSNVGRPFPIKLQWPASSAATTEDFQSWLPGRVYTWISNPHRLGTTPSGGLDGSFYVSNFSSVAGSGDTRTTGGAPYALATTLNGSVSFAGPVHLIARLYRASDETLLASYRAPDFNGVSGTAPQGITASNYQFGFQFRRFESGHVDVGDKGEWLTSSAVGDPRAFNSPSAAFRLDPSRGDDPAQYQTSLDFSDPKFLLDRTQGSVDVASRTYNEDAPLFDLPRAPLLSLGELQHLAIPGQRPFAIGNSWGMDSAAPFQLGSFNASALFDQFFFSGLVSTLTIDETNANWLLPNPQLRRLRNATTGAFASVADLRAAPTSQSSKFLLQGAAFNLNSTNKLAWAAVLRSTRFPAPQSFKYLDADANTGTASDDATATVPSSGDAQFFRFAHAAGETYKAEAGNSGGTANTQLFRQGMRTLTSAQVTALANAIATAIAARQAASGPFLSLEEFLGPTPGATTSLLEQAISDAKINDSVAEFSSQWLTQGDILTTLAPVLFPRSDTFVIRAYGEAVNPTTAAPEGRAWCEATVQRVPAFFDASQPEETDLASLDDLNKAFGRRFKIVSFRWLTRSDI